MGVKGKAWLGNVLLLVVSVGVALVAFETFLAFDDWHPRSTDYMSEVTLNGTTYRFIEDRRAIDQPNTAVLIAGDSFTAGSSCADHRNYPSAFTKAASEAGAGVHAVNLGVQGSGPIAYAARIHDYLEEKGRAAGVIMTLYANDVEIDCDACRYLERWSHLGGLTDADRAELTKRCTSCLRDDTQKLSGETDRTRLIDWWLADRSKTYLLLREIAARFAAGVGLIDVTWGRGAFPDRWKDSSGLYFKHVAAGIELARQDAVARSIPFMVVIYPDPVAINESNEYVPIYRQVQSVLSAQTRVPVFSGYDAFLGNARTRQNMPFSLTDAHPSCEAHDMFGKWVFQKWSAVTPTQTTSRHASPPPR
jgi:lysophospholipase L1-like esterase